MADNQTLQVMIPPELENMKLPSPELVNYYQERNDRYIFIDFDIDESLIEVSKQIMFYNQQDKGIPVEDRKKIFVYIYSYGGDLSAVYSTIAICEASKTPIVTVNMGVAMSAGLLLLLAGHERYCLRRSQALIHQGSATLSGDYSALEENQKSYKKMVEDMKQYILDKTTIDEKTFNKNKSKDWYISDETQVQYGICGKIVDSLDEII